MQNYGMENSCLGKMMYYKKSKSLHIAVKMLYWSNECWYLFLNSRQLFHHLLKLVVRWVGATSTSNEQAFLSMGG